MQKKYRLSAQAENDLLDIFLFGIDNWGTQQAEIYAGQLTDCFSLLAENPNIGIERPEVFDGIRSFTLGSHVIFYRNINSAIEIATIIHQKMDIIKRFKQ